MQLIVINESIFKMIFTEQDMEEYGLDEDEFHLSAINTRRIISEIIKKSPQKRELEDIGSDEKLLIQYYPEKKGGCELFVTRIPLEKDFYEVSDMTDGARDKKLLGLETAKKCTLTYSFSELAWAIAAARELKARKFEGKSTLYHIEHKKYYLSLYPSNSPEAVRSPSCFLPEFGELENSEHMLLYLTEHGALLYEGDAIENLTAM